MLAHPMQMGRKGTAALRFVNHDPAPSPRGQRRTLRTNQIMRSRESRDRFIEDILSDADKARRWAAECAWEPGTGHCRRQRTSECQAECTFRFLRAAEAEQVRRGRQRRAGPSDL